MGILGDDLTAAIAAAQAAAHDEDGRWRGVASETPGLGWEVPLPQPPSSAGGFGVLPVTGEGYEVTPPPAPRQVKADLGQLVFGVQPSYSGPEVSGQHYSYGPQVPREITDLGDGRIMVEQRAAGAGPVLISPATARPSLWQRLAGKLRAKAHDYRQALWWAERGLSIYGSDCARPEYVEDLRKRAARYRAKLGPT